MDDIAFSSDDSDLDNDVERQRTSQERLYAEDPDDNEFIHQLIRATEACIAYAGFAEREQQQRTKLAFGQYETDRLSDQVLRYRRAREPALADYITAKQETLTQYQGDLERAKQDLATDAATTRQSSTRRCQAVRQLYSISQRFIDRCLSHGENEVAPAIGVDSDFRRVLSELQAQNDWVSRNHELLKDYRRRIAHTSRTSSGTRPSAAEKAKRRKLLSGYRSKGTLVEMQRQTHLQKEQDFFLNTVQPLLCKARMLPARDTSVSSSSSGGLSRVGGSTERQLGVGAGTTPSGGTEHPALQTLVRRRAKLAKVTDALRTLQNEYTDTLADFLIIHSDTDKANFDILWERDVAGKSYQVQETEATGAVMEAENAYQQALREAEEAGITELPPSPRDTGDRSEDGNAGSENEAIQADRTRSKNRPETRAWIKRVAKSGSPIDHTSAPQRPPTGVSKRPRGNVKPNWGFMEEGVPRRSRIDRHGRHQDAMRRRYQEQEVERARLGTGPAAPAAPPPPPAPETWLAAVRRQCNVM